MYKIKANYLRFVRLHSFLFLFLCGSFNDNFRGCEIFHSFFLWFIVFCLLLVFGWALSECYSLSLSLSLSLCLEIADFFNDFLMNRIAACRSLGFQNLFFALVEFCRLSCWVGFRHKKWMAYSIYGLCYTLLFIVFLHTHLWLCHGGLIKPMKH